MSKHLVVKKQKAQKDLEMLRAENDSLRKQIRSLDERIKELKGLENG